MPDRPPVPAPSIDQQVGWARAALTHSGELDAATRQAAMGVVFELLSRLEAMLEHTGDMITVVAADGAIRYSNRAAGALTGHDESVNGTAAFSFIHDDDQARAIEAFVECMEEPGREMVVEFRLRYADGSWHHVEAFAKNCLDDPTAGVVVSMRDITERKAGEAALVAANEMMQEFVAVAAHELRGPMSVIRGFSSLAEKRWGELDDPSKLDMIGAISRSSERLGRLIDDLLVLSRLDAGAPDGEASTIEVAGLVSAVLDDVGATAVDVHLPADLTVLATDHQVRRIVRNYVENAVRYGRPPIVVDAVVHDAHIDLRVRDVGDGVPAGMEERVFERFASADQVASRAHGGSGLGLSIVRGLANANGGEAWYEPNEPRGSSFVVRLRRGA